MGIEEAKSLLREAREKYSAGRCVTALVTAQRSISEAMKFAENVEVPGWAREKVNSLCKSSPWTTPICEPEIGPTPQPEEGSCSKIDAEETIKIAEEIIEVLEEVRKKKKR